MNSTIRAINTQANRGGQNNNRCGDVLERGGSNSKNNKTSYIRTKHNNDGPATVTVIQTVKMKSSESLLI